MESLSEEDDQFFDTKEYATPVSDSGSDGVENSDSESRVVEGLNRSNLGYEVWIKSPGRIHDRRQNLLKLMGLAQNDGLDEVGSESRDKFGGEFVGNNKVKEIRRLVSRLSFRELRSLSSHSSTSCCSSDIQDVFDMTMDENLVPRIRNLECGTEYDVDEYTQDWLFGRLREAGPDQSMSGDEFERILGQSVLGQSVLIRDIGMTSNKPARSKKVKKGLLTRLGIMANVAVTKQGDTNYVEDDGMLPSSRGKTQISKVRSYRKQSKEFSALYKGQDIVAHEGAILTMKFSPDGQLLASAGEDEIVRIWQVIESHRSDLVHVPDADSSHVYFTANHLGELEPTSVNKFKKSRLKSLRKSEDSACVIFPLNVFKLEEKPLHEFQGHSGEVLDLSWSNSKCILSSSADKTVRLWRVGFNECLQVFSHNNFVTRVQFNPVDENYFISGSVDGKVRSWSISGCKVVDWTDIKEIVTAICYKPDGKGAIIGSIAGDCYFYDTSDNRLQMTDQTSLQGKKKTACRRITAFQFSDGDPTKLIVTTADSHVQIFQGVDLICKYKGLRNAGSQISPSFTSDGAHVVSASEDSFIYIWDSRRGPVSSQVQSKMSCERFFSNNASLAIPWCGTPSENALPCLSATSSDQDSGIMVMYSTENGQECNSPVLNSPRNRPISLGFSDPFSRKVATWPEEKLMTSSNSLKVSSTTTKSDFMFLKTACQNMAGSTHAWGSVILSAGWDGRIRVFQNFGLPIYS
ncbi:uncharacterized protein LOC141586186 [Silene latifolia]|uniref:uncharacterized protein LOC141586186 n=1 Tax=Silene latifolia TaxID=37657 RepID=UPI003D778CA8